MFSTMEPGGGAKPRASLLPITFFCSELARPDLPIFAFPLPQTTFLAVPDSPECSVLDPALAGLNNENAIDKSKFKFYSNHYYFLITMYVC